MPDTSPTRRTRSVRDPTADADLRALRQAIDALTARVEALEGRARGTSGHDADRGHAAALPLDGRYWLIHALERHPDPAGALAFGGRVTLGTGETYYWQIERAAAGLLGQDWTPAAGPLAALAHPVRLAILRALLTGTGETTALAALPGLGTTGQLYHHLKPLEAAGWIRQPRRGEYAVVAERAIPLLAVLAACELPEAGSKPAL